MQIDYLIAGQGISGTWLSWYLEKENISYLVTDDHDEKAPSRLAAGIINPITGRRHVSTWMIEKLLPFAWEAYTRLGDELGITGISRRNIIDFFPNPQMRESFLKRVAEKTDYVFAGDDGTSLNDYFHYEFGYGEIRPVYTAHLEAIIPAWRKKLIQENRLRTEKLHWEELEIFPDHIRYRDIRARKIIFCDGAAGADNPWFKLLPFAPNKGQALFLEIPGLPAGNIYKKGLSLVPLLRKDHWWLGSAYEWDFTHTEPTVEFREKAESALKQWLKIPWKVINHIASIRPATIERRPFAGLHPLYPSLGILNGMGTKGCSLAPWFARELTQHLLHNSPIHPEADLRRFNRILSRDIS